MVSRREALKATFTNVLVLLPSLSNAQVIQQGGNSHEGSANQLFGFLLNKASDQRILRRSKDFYRLNDSELAELCNSVTARVVQPDLDHQPSRGVEKQARAIASAVDEVIQSRYPTANILARERLLIQGLYDWVRTHLVYNLWLADLRRDREVRNRYWYAKDLFELDKPNAVCVGYANSFVSLATSLGIDAFTVVGCTRRQFKNDKLPVEGWMGGHQWAICRQKDGFLLPVDPTNSAVSLGKARELSGRVPEPITLPIGVEDWALHFAIYHATTRPFVHSYLPSKESNTSLSYTDWRMLDISVLQNSYRRKVGMTWFSTAMVDWPLVR